MQENGNGVAEFKLHLGTAFLVVEHISKYASEANKEQTKEQAKEQTKEQTNKQTNKLTKDTNKEQTNKQTKKQTNKLTNKLTKDTNKEQTNKQTKEQTNKQTNIKKQINELYLLIKWNPSTSYKELMENLGVKRNTLAQRIKVLKAQGILTRLGGTYGGKWQINESLYLQLYSQSETIL